MTSSAASIAMLAAGAALVLSRGRGRHALPGHVEIRCRREARDQALEFGLVARRARQARTAPLESGRNQHARAVERAVRLDQVAVGRLPAREAAHLRRRVIDQQLIDAEAPGRRVHLGRDALDLEAGDDALALDARRGDHAAGTREAAHLESVPDPQAVDPARDDGIPERCCGADLHRLAEHDQARCRPVDRLQRSLDVVVEDNLLRDAGRAARVERGLDPDDLPCLEIGLRAGLVVDRDGRAARRVVHSIDDHAAEAADRPLRDGDSAAIDAGRRAAASAAATTAPRCQQRGECAQRESNAASVGHGVSPVISS